MHWMNVFQKLRLQIPFKISLAFEKNIQVWITAGMLPNGKDAVYFDFSFFNEKHMR